MTTKNNHLNHREMICIEWIDASIAVETETYSHEDACKEDLIHGFACGVLVEEKSDCYVVARDWFDKHNTYRGISVYPKSGIKQVKKYAIFQEAK